MKHGLRGLLRCYIRYSMLQLKSKNTALEELIVGELIKEFSAICGTFRTGCVHSRPARGLCPQREGSSPHLPVPPRAVFVVSPLQALHENAVFWDIMPCGTCTNQCFGRTYNLHHHGEKVCKLLTDSVFFRSLLQSLVTANVSCHPDDGGDTFLRNVGSY
jgi:hypothetical protein